MYLLPNADINYLNEILLDRSGRLQILPYGAFRGVPQEHLSQFCVQHGFYCLPTMELVDWLRAEIDGHKTIEIGSGNGVLAETIGIPATDSKVQSTPTMQAKLQLAQQTPVSYGSNVLRYDALDAVRRFKPHTVLAAWVTHKYNPAEHWRDGFDEGVDEIAVLRKVKKYIFVGNEEVHAKKPILQFPHTTFNAPWLLSRAMNGAPNVIWVWDREAQS